jgi:formamidopyrimidine-DNA glycosylase
MDQKVISGIGNYLRADVLWSSKISPFRKVKDLTEKEINNIYNITRTLTWTSYDYPKGIKLKTIKTNIKLPYTYKRNFFVYGQENDIYGNKIIKKELFEGSQKRFIYYVKELQL